MHRPLWLQLLTAFAVVAGVWSIWRVPSQKRAFDKLLQRAMDSYRKSIVQSEQERFSFNGTTAEVVLVEPIGMREDSFALTVYARNHAGEYFMFKATGKNHWLKHVEPHVAKAVLKHRFIPPAESIGA